MQLHFVSREEYRLKESPVFIEGLKNKFGNFYIIPEGGNNELGEKGCVEILPAGNNFDFIFCACGTGTTFKGISNSLLPNQELIGINILKFKADYLTNSPIHKSRIENDYHFGGYAKHTDELLAFKNKFETENKIPLDYVYTAKLFFAVDDMIKKNKIPADSKILVVHSGGLQGNKGYEERYFLMPNRNVKDAQG